MKSVLGSISWKDAGKALILIIITTIVTGIYQALQSGTFDLTWVFMKPIVISALGAALAYIIKNFLTNSQDQFLTSEKK